jgi:CheY-like chemotaxis protein
MAVFEIEDTGPGIAPDDIDRIFEPFSRGAHAGEGLAAGTGLGLTIAKMLTDLMGGEMTVTTRLASATAAADALPGASAAAESGTVFRVRLFLPEIQGAPVLPQAPLRSAYAGPRQRILVVDNEEVDRSLLARRLEAVGFDVLQAGSGQAALGLLREAAAGDGAASVPQVQAILMDLAMPGIDGWETLRVLKREALSAAPVAIVSANAYDKGLDNDAGIGAADFFTKPVRFDELLDWLGLKLGLRWLPTPASHVALPAAQRAAPADAPRPPREELLALQEAVNLGYPRGVQRLLGQIEAERPDCAAWVAPLRALAQSFQFDLMTPLIQDALAKSQIV